MLPSCRYVINPTALSLQASHGLISIVLPSSAIAWPDAQQRTSKRKRPTRPGQEPSHLPHTNLSRGGSGQPQRLARLWNMFVGAIIVLITSSRTLQPSRVLSYLKKFWIFDWAVGHVAVFRSLDPALRMTAKADSLTHCLVASPAYKHGSGLAAHRASAGQLPAQIRPDVCLSEHSGPVSTSPTSETSTGPVFISKALP